VNRTLPAPAGDVALLLTRLLLGTIMFAHGYQKLVINGIGRTSQGFEHMSIPVAIMSASFVTVVEFVGGALLVLGALTTVVACLQIVIMVGAAVYVHARHGIFVADGGWELVGAIAAGLLAVAAAGPGRYSVARLVGAHRGRAADPAAAAPDRAGPPPVERPVAPEPIPPAGLPLIPLVRFDDPGPGFRRP
jgi:putative oxidoreductase